jgi:hypothetical protein
LDPPPFPLSRGNDKRARDGENRIYVTLSNGWRQVVTFEKGALNANVPDATPETDMVTIVREAVRVFGADNVRKVDFPWVSYPWVDLDGPLFTELRSLPNLVGILVQDGQGCVAEQHEPRPWPLIRTLELRVRDIDASTVLGLFPHLESLNCWEARDDGGVEETVNAMARLPFLHTVHAERLDDETLAVLALPNIRRVVCGVDLPLSPAVLAAIRGRAAVPHAKRLILSLTDQHPVRVPALVTALQALLHAATLGGVTLKLTASWPERVCTQLRQAGVPVQAKTILIYRFTVQRATMRIQRAYRAYRVRRCAVRRIEAAVIDWLLRPGGSASRAAAARFAVLSTSHQ